MKKDTRQRTPRRRSVLTIGVHQQGRKMKKTLLALALTGLLCSVTGCASSPLSQWFRGAPCNTCNPPVSQPFGGSIASGCGTACEQPKRGIFDWLRNPFQSQSQPSGILPSGNFPNGNFPVDPGVQYYGDPGIPAGAIQPLEIITPVGATTPNAIGSGVLNQGSIAPNTLETSTFSHGSFAQGSFGNGSFINGSFPAPTEHGSSINEINDFGSSISEFESSINPTLNVPPVQTPTPSSSTFGSPVSGELYGAGIRSGIPPIGPDGF